MNAYSGRKWFSIGRGIFGGHGGGGKHEVHGCGGHGYCERNIKLINGIDVSKSTLYFTKK